MSGRGLVNVHYERGKVPFLAGWRDAHQKERTYRAPQLVEKTIGKEAEQHDGGVKE